MKAIFAGSFDPFTIGHLDIVQRAAKCFEHVFISILYNPGKDTCMFSVDERETLIRDAVSGIPNITVTHFDGLLVEYASSLGADCIIRGIRTGGDVDYERMLETVNHKLDGEMETLYLLSKPEHSHISSSLVRQLLMLHIGIEDIVPNADNTIYLERK